MYSSKRLTDKVKPWIVKSLKSHGEAEEIIWEMSITSYPDPTTVDDQGRNGSLPALVVYLEIGTDDGETRIYSAPVLAPFGLTFEIVDKAIENALTDMRKTRSERVLTDSNS